MSISDTFPYGYPGGAQAPAVGTEGVAIDLSALAHKTVKIWADKDLLFCFAADSSNTELIFEGSLQASRSALKADQAAANVGVFRGVLKQYPWLIVSTVTGTTTVHVKRV